MVPTTTTASPFFQRKLQFPKPVPAQDSISGKQVDPASHLSAFESLNGV